MTAVITKREVRSRNDSRKKTRASIEECLLGVIFSMMTNQVNIGELANKNPIFLSLTLILIKSIPTSKLIKLVELNNIDTLYVKLTLKPYCHYVSNQFLKY